MKACIVLQNQYSRIGHAIAIQLSKRGVSELSAYVISSGAAKFVREQKDIEYKHILIDHELHSAAFTEKLDLEFIKNFENTYSPPPIWQFLYNDRKLMMSIGPKEESTAVIDPLYDHETLLKIFQMRARAIEAMLKQSRPDFIIFFAIGCLAHLILYHVSKKMGIRTFNIDFPRVGNLICVSEDYCTLTGVEKIFKETALDPATTEAHVNAQKFVKNFKETGSLRLEYFESFAKNFLKKRSLLNPKNLFVSARYLVTLFRNYWNNRGVFSYGITDLNPLLFILYKLKERYRAWSGLSDLYTKPLEGEDFAFFPLHFEPELALLLLSPAYFDQVALIRVIARSLPVHFKLYVKEHPAMRNKRPRAYYKELLKIPNVRLINPLVSSFELIKKTKLVTTITGTVGWEASLLGKPVITFGEVFYNVLSFVKRCNSLEALPALIVEQLKNFRYNEEETLRLVVAVLQDGFAFKFFELWYEEDFEKLKVEPAVARFAEEIIKKMSRPAL